MAILDSRDPPESHALEARQAIDDEWRIVDDEDWPCQLVSSITQKDPWTAPHEDDDSGLQLLADQAVLHDVTPKESESSCQQAPTRVSLLTRPETSGDDPGAGFSFTKAQPLQKLDFTRGPKQNTTVPSNGEAISSSHDTASNIHSRVSPAVSENTKSAEFLDTAPSKRIDIRVQPRIPLLSSPLTEGSTVADPVDFRPHNHLSTKSMSKPVLEDPPLKASENGISKTPDYTLVDPEFCGPNTTRETGLLSNKYKTDAVKPVSDYVAAQVTNNGEFQAADHSKSIKTFSREPHTFGTAAPKVTKIRRRKTAAGPVGNEAPRFVNNNTWTEDNIMDFLSYKVKQGRQEREQIKCAYEAKEVEIHRLRQAIDSLYTQLQEMDKRHSEKTSELSKIKAAKPGWESKIKKLTDYVKGLTNDHNRLRDDAKDLQEQQGSISDDYQDLKDSLKEAHRAIKHERGASKQVIGEARRELEQLGCTIRLQRKQLESDETLLLAEHKRSDRLEDQISSFSANHGQLLELFASHRESMFAKIDDLVIKTLDVHPLSNTGPQDDVRPMLAECLKLVQHLHAAENLRPADLEKLGVSMDSCIASIARSIESCKEATTSTGFGQQQLALVVQDQFRDLSSNIMSQATLSERIMDLREMKATVGERLQATETALTNARLEVLALQSRDQEKSRKIVALEVEAAQDRSQPTEAPQTMLRIQELDSKNKDLQHEISALTKEATELSDQLQQRTADVTGLVGRLADTETLLENSRRETTAIQKEKAASEERALVDRESMRKELSSAANMQLANVRNEHMNVVQQLKLKKSPADDKLKDVTRQLSVLQIEKERYEKDNGQLKASLDSMEQEKERDAEKTKALQARNTELQKRLGKNINDIRDIQIKLDQADAGVKARNEHIRVLQTQLCALPSKPSSSRPALQIPSIQGTVRSKHSTNPPVVVEDFQPRDPQFVSLGDIMVNDMNDPFVEYAQEGSQPMVVNDLDDLFPSTPKVATQDRDYSRISVSRTRVISREINASVGHQRPETVQGIAPSVKQSKGESDQTNGFLGSPHTFEAPVLPSNKAPIKTSSRHRPSQVRDPRDQPKGILKEPRGEKRSANVPDMRERDTVAGVKRLRMDPKTESRPTIADPQSPSNLRSGRNRKMSSKPGKKSTKEEKMMERFNQGAQPR